MSNPLATYHAQFSNQDVEVVAQQMLYQGFVQVESITLRHRLFDTAQYSNTIQREIVRRREAAGVFVYDPMLQKFLLIEQFRAAAINTTDTPWHLEIIAGLIDAGEDAVTCIKREALEEAGCKIDNPEFIYRYYPSTGASDEVFNFYTATADLSACGGIHGCTSEGEDIKVHIFDYADSAKLLEQRALHNAPVIIAMQWFQSTILSRTA